MPNVLRHLLLGSLSALALAAPAAAGRRVVRTIVRPPHLVNLVTGPVP